MTFSLPSSSVFVCGRMLALFWFLLLYFYYIFFCLCSFYLLFSLQPFYFCSAQIFTIFVIFIRVNTLTFYFLFRDSVLEFLVTSCRYIFWRVTTLVNKINMFFCMKSEFLLVWCHSPHNSCSHSQSIIHECKIVDDSLAFFFLIRHYSNFWRCRFSLLSPHFCHFQLKFSARENFECMEK